MSVSVLSIVATLSFDEQYSKLSILAFSGSISKVIFFDSFISNSISASLNLLYRYF